MEKGTTGILKTNPIKYGKAVLRVKRQSKKVRYEFYVMYDDDDELGYMNADRFKVDHEFYFIGNLQFLFMMVGQSGLLGGHYIFCELKRSEWVSHHGKKDNGRIKCHAPLCNMEGLILPYDYRHFKKSTQESMVRQFSG